MISTVLSPKKIVSMLLTPVLSKFPIWSLLKSGTVLSYLNLRGSAASENIAFTVADGRQFDLNFVGFVYMCIMF